MIAISVAGESYELPSSGPVTFVFGDDGSLTGSGFCNDFGASYRVEGDGLVVEGFYQTALACASPPGAEDGDAVVFSAITQKDVSVSKPTQDSLWITSGIIVMDLAHD